MFRDPKGNVIEIEIRGERKIDSIFFKANDIEKGFGLNGIRKTIQNRDDREQRWCEGKHYVRCFIVSKVPNGDGAKDKRSNQLFLTLIGSTKLLYVSRSKKFFIVEKFDSVKRLNNIINLFSHSAA